MFEEIITEAAELLAEKQLGIKRNKDSDKEENLPVMLVQFREIYERELTEQFNKICATMKMKFDLRELEPKTMHNIAIEIKDVVEDAVKDGNPVSISGIFQNTAIIKVAEKETARQKEAATDIEKIQETPIILPENKEDDKIAEQARIDKIFEGLGKISNSLKKINELAQNCTIDNFDETRIKVRQIIHGPERKQEDKEKALSYIEILNNGTPEQKIQTLNKIRRDEIIKKRQNMSDEDRIKTRPAVSGMLYTYMQNIYSGNNEFDKSIAEIREFIMDEASFSADEATQMLEDLKKCKTKDDLADALANKMVNLAKERGKNIDKKRIMHTAQTSTKEATDLTGQLGGREDVLARLYSTAILDNTQDKRVKDLLNSLRGTIKRESYDLNIIDEVKDVSEELYLSLVRNIGIASKRKNDPILIKKFDELISKEAEEQMFKLHRDGLIKIRKQQTESEQKDNRKIITGVLYNFMLTTSHNSQTIEKQKDAIKKYLTGEGGLSEQEKVELFHKIENASSKSELNDVLFEKMNELTVERGKPELNKEKILMSAQKASKPSELVRMQAKAKVIFTDQLYNRYVTFQNSVIKSSFTGPYDEKLLELVRQKDPEIYATLMETMKKVATQRNDINLASTYNHFLEMDKAENKIAPVKGETMKEQEIVNTRNRLDTGNIIVSDVVRNFSDGCDRLVREVKIKSQVDDDGRG